MNEIERLVRATIPQMPREFDTHELILRLAHENQTVYVRLLSEVPGESPFQTLHSQIGKAVKAVSGEFSLVGVASSSKDIFGQQNSCVRWSPS